MIMGFNLCTVKNTSDELPQAYDRIAPTTCMQNTMLLQHRPSYQEGYNYLIELSSALANTVHLRRGPAPDAGPRRRTGLLLAGCRCCRGSLRCRTIQTTCGRPPLASCLPSSSCVAAKPPPPPVSPPHIVPSVYLPGPNNMQGCQREMGKINQL